MSEFVILQIVANGAHNFIRRAPEFVSADAIKGNLARLGPAGELPLFDVMDFRSEEIVDADLENLVDLSLLALPGGRWAVQATQERCNPESGRHRFDNRQARQNLDT